MSYAIIVTSQEARSSDGTVVTRDGKKFWLVKDEWVEVSVYPVIDINDMETASLVCQA